MRSFDGASKFEREKWSTEMSPVLNLWKKLNQGSSILQAKLSVANSEGNIDPVKAFIQLEYFNAAQLIQKIHKSLVGLSKVIRGTLLLDEVVSKLAESLMKQETPPTWQKFWKDPKIPWNTLRLSFRKPKVLKSGTPKGSIPGSDEALDMSDLFHPDTYLGALRQSTSRNMKSQWNP